MGSLYPSTFVQWRTYGILLPGARNILAPPIKKTIEFEVKIDAKVWKKQTKHLMQLFCACLLGNTPHSALKTNSTKMK